jgi:hypothetical protein
MRAPLYYLSGDIVASLRERIVENVDRYISGDFADLSKENGWSIESRLVRVDSNLLSSLKGTPRSAEADVKNSQVVHAALEGMTPAMARDERVWTRLTHVECLGYSRERWLTGVSGEALHKSIASHMFAQGRTGIRDDNALSRLWWNMHIASIADPADPVGALNLIAKTADVRMQFVERPGSAARPPLARALVRALRRDPWIGSSEGAFRNFMIVLNRDGGGVLFEALSDQKVDALMSDCAAKARERLNADADAH